MTDLSQCPFDYQETKNGLVQKSYKGKTITSMKGKETAKFLNKVDGASTEQTQLVMAKATGHFKHV